LTPSKAAPPVAAPSAPPVGDASFFGHPRGLSTLFFTEMWERFSYYGMRAILILYMTAPLAIGGLAFPDEKAGIIYGTYTSLVYLTALPGGWLADKLMGQRRAVLWGGVLIMFGHICLAVPQMATFYLGLLLVVSGTGLLKPNISAMVGQLYSPDDIRRDAGFSIFYMGINLGAGSAPLVCGFLAQSSTFRETLQGWGIAPESSWHWGFGAAAVGMFLGLVQYVLGGKRLGQAGLEPAPVKGPEEWSARKRAVMIAVGALVLVIGSVVALASAGVITVTADGVGRVFGWLLLAIVVGFFTWLFTASSWSREERKRLMVIFVLFIAAAVFWSVFEQAGSTLNLFAERSVNNSILGKEFPASFWQSVNSAFLVLLAPVFAALWLRLGPRDPSSPTKFSVGLLFAGLGFVVLAGGAAIASTGTRVGPIWLISVYLLHTIGELCLSPVGLSAMTRLAPQRIVGLMMGVWFMATSVGNYLGGRVAGLYQAFALPTLFLAVAGYAIIFAVILALLVRPIKRMLARA
jgi:POT family proton-dependent oligopeptide transporter